MSSGISKILLFVITKATWGGAQRNIYDLALAAKDAGYRVIVAIGTAGELTERLQEAGIETQQVAGLGRDIDVEGDWRAFGALKKIIHDVRPDVVHAHSSKAGFLATLAARLMGTPCIIFTAHGWAYNEQRPWWQKLIFAKLHYLTVLFADTTICVSNAIRRQARWMPFVQGRFVVIRNGIGSIEHMSRDAARRAVTAHPHMHTDNVLWIGTIAELHKTKGLDVLLNAFAKVAAAHPHAHLVIFGEGGERANLEKLIAHHGLENRAYLLGHVVDAKKYLLALDIFAFPSRSEALGYALLEAGLASLPAVASNVGGIPEIITHNENGMLVAAGNSDDLSHELLRLIGNPELRARLGSNLYTTTTEHFSHDAMIEKTLSLYEK